MNAMVGRLGRRAEVEGMKRDVSDKSLWIFGYGSLVWRPEFPHLRACAASIGGFTRRFWQGSTDHRGLPGRPGRVVTLVPLGGEGLCEEEGSEKERCWGMAYEISSLDPDQVLAGLDHRERGGYERIRLEIEIHAEPMAAERALQVTGLVYIAGPQNENYLGDATIDTIANQIATASGPSGGNPEYVFELAHRLRDMRAQDAHVYAVEAELKRVMARGSGDLEQAGAAGTSPITGD